MQHRKIHKCVDNVTLLIKSIMSGHYLESNQLWKNCCRFCDTNIFFHNQKVFAMWWLFQASHYTNNAEYKTFKTHWPAIDWLGLDKLDKCNPLFSVIATRNHSLNTESKIKINDNNKFLLSIQLCLIKANIIKQPG